MADKDPSLALSPKSGDKQDETHHNTPVEGGLKSASPEILISTIGKNDPHVAKGVNKSVTVSEAAAAVSSLAGAAAATITTPQQFDGSAEQVSGITTMQYQQMMLTALTDVSKQLVQMNKYIPEIMAISHKMDKVLDFEKTLSSLNWTCIQNKWITPTQHLSGGDGKQTVKHSTPIKQDTIKKKPS